MQHEFTTAANIRISRIKNYTRACIQSINSNNIDIRSGRLHRTCT